jgi:hypothetical protein
MEKVKLNTWFAPAERADMSEVRRQYFMFKENPLLLQTLDSVLTGVLILNEHRQLALADTM